MISWVAYLSVGLVIGIGVGVYASRLDMFRSKKQLELEQKLHDTQEELSRYRKDVAQHFVETSTLVNNMTESYRAVFAHLSHGAKTLCGDEVEAYRLDLPEKHLIGESAAAPTAKSRDDNAVPTTPASTSDDELAADAPVSATGTGEDSISAEQTDTGAAEAGSEAPVKQGVDLSETTADDISTIPGQPASVDVPSVRESQANDDEHAAFLGEQDGPPVSSEEAKKSGKPPTVH